ncbi:MAG: peptide-methionine (S)-S-oxide reductase MsrA [Anaerolineales bacterium]|nr:peptide-methionine (S)-S-oxide reductase MsrA [Anaerolineales bacterium]
MSNSSENVEKATLGGGCFWCLEPVYNDLIGVEQVEVGYAGGDIPDPTYRAVCSGTTGHAEVAQITFDPQEISFRELLEVFFSIHDPTTLNRQGADVGTQYRSVIFYHDDQQRQIAQEAIDSIDAESIWGRQIVTELSPLDAYYPAEDYHQGYYQNNPGQPYCQMVIRPKIEKFEKTFKGKRKSIAAN